MANQGRWRRWCAAALVGALAACTSPLAGQKPVLVDAGADVGYDSGLSDLVDVLELADALPDVPDTIGDAADAQDTTDTKDASTPDVFQCLPASVLYSAAPLPADSPPVCLFDNKTKCTETAVPAPVAVTDTTCSPACPAPYPCYCGACPWLPTAPMVYPRYGHKAVWTGKEIIVFGSFVEPLGIQAKFTGERWDPYGKAGWQLINTPPDTWENQDAKPEAMSVIWTGKVVLVTTFYGSQGSGPIPSFRWDPATDTWSPMSTVGAPDSGGFRAQWAGGKLYQQGNTSIGVYDPESDKWQAVPWPAAFLPAGQTMFDANIAPSGDDLFAYDVWKDPKLGPWPDGTTNTIHTLRLHVPTLTWTPVVTPSFVTVAGNSSAIDGFKDGFFVWGQGKNAAKNAPSVGAIYWKAKDAWLPMNATGQQPWGVGIKNIWIGAFAAIGPAFGGLGPYPAGFGFGDWSWPIFFDPHRNVWIYPPPWGGPADGRVGQALVATDSELFVLGGIDGPSGANVVHNDGVRLPLPPTPTGG